MRFASFRRSRFCAYETCSVFRCPFVPYRVHYPLYIVENLWTVKLYGSLSSAARRALRFYDVAILGMV